MGTIKVVAEDLIVQFGDDEVCRMNFQASMMSKFPQMKILNIRFFIISNANNLLFNFWFKGPYILTGQWMFR